MKSIVECVANISEGQQPSVIETIAEKVRSVTGVTLLDIHSDGDHNRSVLTFVGQSEPVKTAAFALIKEAVSQIDLTQHSGVHPRIGAADVVPFVPIGNTTMQTCIDLAHQLGEQVSTELGLPVYLYGEAALRPERHELAQFRKLGFEALRNLVAENSDYAPDMGPYQFGAAGAVAIGARQPLVAYNIYLNTDDVAMAQQIAKAVRYSTGGLRNVKALGLLVDGQAQVSMNLTNIKQTPIHRVQELVRREAARYGCQITQAELVGLVPQQAVLEAAAWYLQLPKLSADQILEQRVFGAIENE